VRVPCVGHPQGKCKGCGKGLKEQRESIKSAPAEDKGVWKDSGRALTYMQQKAEYAYKAADGKAHIALMVYRPELARNKISWYGELLTNSMVPVQPTWPHGGLDHLQCIDYPCTVQDGLRRVSFAHLPTYGCAVVSAMSSTV
jgi:hypothetical protein